MRASKGFTLIELMIVIAIIGILSTMAVPIQRDKVIKAQVQEAIQLSAIAQNAIESFREKTGHIPGNNQTAGIPAPNKIIGNYVTQLEIVGGAIHITFGNRAHKDILGKTLTIRPSIVENETQVPIAWLCGNAEKVNGMSVSGANQTTLLPQELPIDCRV